MERYDNIKITLIGVVLLTSIAVDGSSPAKIIWDLLEYSMVGTRGKKFRLASSNVALEKALANLRFTIEEMATVIKYDSLPEVVADESQFMQVFKDIIGNSIKFNSS